MEISLRLRSAANYLGKFGSFEKFENSSICFDQHWTRLYSRIYDGSNCHLVHLSDIRPHPSSNFGSTFSFIDGRYGFCDFSRRIPFFLSSEFSFVGHVYRNALLICCGDILRRTSYENKTRSFSHEKNFLLFVDLHSVVAKLDFDFFGCVY